eukprot:scaffold79311_cov28-Tisochrysis_lutea.AAC.2
MTAAALQQEECEQDGCCARSVAALRRSQLTSPAGHPECVSTAARSCCSSRAANMVTMAGSACDTHSSRRADISSANCAPHAESYSAWPQAAMHHPRQNQGHGRQEPQRSQRDSVPKGEPEGAHRSLRQPLQMPSRSFRPSRQSRPERKCARVSAALTLPHGAVSTAETIRRGTAVGATDVPMLRQPGEARCAWPPLARCKQDASEHTTGAGAEIGGTAITVIAAPRAAKASEARGTQGAQAGETAQRSAERALAQRRREGGAGTGAPGQTSSRAGGGRARHGSWRDEGRDRHARRYPGHSWGQRRGRSGLNGGRGGGDLSGSIDSEALHVEVGGQVAQVRLVLECGRWGGSGTARGCAAFASSASAFEAVLRGYPLLGIGDSHLPRAPALARPHPACRRHPHHGEHLSGGLQPRVHPAHSPPAPCSFRKFALAPKVRLNPIEEICLFIGARA